MKLTKSTSLVTRELLGTYLKAQEQFVSSPGDITRLHSLRPSQLPFCPLNVFINGASFGAMRVMNMHSSFFTTVGTAVHEVLQQFLGLSGKFLADWRCPICGKWNRQSHVNECCDMDMEYHEIKINYRGVIGHIDAVFRDSLGRYWIVDFKTTSVKGAPTKQKNPGRTYIEQVETYANTLYRQYGIKCHGVCLFFVRRDSPNDPVVWSRELGDDDYTRITKRTKMYLKMHQQVMNVKTLDQAYALAEYGKCKGPYCRTCRTTAPIYPRLKSAYRIGKAASRLPLASSK